MTTFRSDRLAAMAAVACSLHGMEEMFEMAVKQAEEFRHNLGTTKPQSITYGPQRKGKGGKIKKW